MSSESDDDICDHCKVQKAKYGLVGEHADRFLLFSAPGVSTPEGLVRKCLEVRGNDRGMTPALATEIVQQEPDIARQLCMLRDEVEASSDVDSELKRLDAAAFVATVRKATLHVVAEHISETSSMLYGREVAASTLGQGSKQPKHGYCEDDLDSIASHLFVSDQDIEYTAAHNVGDAGSFVNDMEGFFQDLRERTAGKALGLSLTRLLLVGALRHVAGKSWVDVRKQVDQFLARTDGLTDLDFMISLDELLREAPTDIVQAADQDFEGLDARAAVYAVDSFVKSLKIPQLEEWQRNVMPGWARSGELKVFLDSVKRFLISHFKNPQAIQEAISTYGHVGFIVCNRLSTILLHLYVWCSKRLCQDPRSMHGFDLFVSSCGSFTALKSGAVISPDAQAMAVEGLRFLANENLSSMQKAVRFCQIV